MQLIEAELKSDDERLTPAIYAALVDSLFQNPAPMLAGPSVPAHAAVMTAIKTGNLLMWPCALLIVMIGDRAHVANA